MPLFAKKCNTLLSIFLPTILMLSGVACSSKADRKSAIESEIKKVRLDIEPVEPKKITLPVFKKSHASAHPSPVIKSIPKKILVPEILQDKNEDSLDDLIGEEEEAVSDSSQEVLYYYFLGQQQILEGKYETAIRNLEHFLLENPTHVYADRAQYWIIEANCRAKEYQLCLLSANALQSRYPYSLKIPDSLFLKTLALKKMGQDQEAKQLSLKLFKDFPDHPLLVGKQNE